MARLLPPLLLPLLALAALLLAAAASAEEVSSLALERSALHRDVREADHGRKKKRKRTRNIKKRKKAVKRKKKRGKKNVRQEQLLCPTCECPRGSKPRKTDMKSRKKRKRSRKMKNGKRKKGQRKHSREERLCPECVCEPEQETTTRSPDTVEPATPAPGQDCLRTAVAAMKLYKDTVNNFRKQAARVAKQSSLATNKAAKALEFTELSTSLAELSCGDTAATEAVTNLTSVLGSCEASINQSCVATFPETNMTLIEDCMMITDDFAAETDKCLMMTVKGGKQSDSCSCWDGDTLAALASSVKQCRISEAAKEVNMATKLCIAEFSGCRKAQDAANLAIKDCLLVPMVTTTTASARIRRLRVVDKFKLL